MAEIIETSGKTVEDALSVALDKLGCGRAEITYEVLQEPSGGFLGLWGKREARIRVTTRPVIPSQRTEIATLAQPTVIASTPAPASSGVNAREQSGADDGFGVQSDFTRICAPPRERILRRAGRSAARNVVGRAKAAAGAMARDGADAIRRRSA